MIKTALAVYFIAGSNNLPKETPLEALEEALAAGVTLFQFREKGEGALTGTAYEEFARACQALCKQYKVPFIVNDDVDLAILLQADGVHIGQSDRNCAEVRKKVGANQWIGVSANTCEQAQQAVNDGANYIGVGPVYATSTKRDTEPVLGVAGLQEIAQAVSCPLVAIGGITVERTPAIIQAGADGVSVISAIASSPTISSTVHQFREAVQIGRGN